MAKNRTRIHKVGLNKSTPIIGVCLGAQLEEILKFLKQGSPPKPFPKIGWSQVFLINHIMT